MSKKRIDRRTTLVIGQEAMRSLVMEMLRVGDIDNDVAVKWDTMIRNMV